MFTKNSLLLLSGLGDSCCLCLSNAKELINLSDEIALHIDENIQCLPVSTIISTVFGSEVSENISIFSTICSNCSGLAISSYNFLTASKKNLLQLSKSAESLLEVFENISDLEHRNLFLELSPLDCTPKIYQDNGQPIRNLCNAAKTFNSIVNFQIKPKQENIDVKLEILPEKKELLKKSRKFNIGVADICDTKLVDEIKCEECGKSYSTHRKFKLHFMRCHLPKEHRCSQCKRSYGTVGLLAAHKRECHSKVVCHECGKVFSNTHSLKTHEKRHSMFIICQDCGRTYKNPNTFKQHKELNICNSTTRASNANAKYTCDYCNKKYTQKVTLRVHIQYEHMSSKYKGHKCKWCGKKFWAQSRLRAHIVKHTREKNFKCNICSGNFVTKESLLYHTRIHTGEKPYACDYCDKRFLSASRRLEHVKSRHLQTLIQCDTCTGKFKTKNALLKHKSICLYNLSKADKVVTSTDSNSEPVEIEIPVFY